MEMSTATFKGSFDPIKYMGEPSDPKNRQYSSTSPGYNTPGDVGNTNPGPTADIYMVPDFQGESGQGNNRSDVRGQGMAS